MFVKRLTQILFLFASLIFAQGVGSAVPVSEPVPVAQPASAVPAQPSQAPSDTNKSTISVFVKSPEELRLLQEELKTLQTMAGDSNPEIASLIARANRVAVMNDRCSSISINDLLDTTCARFYEVELPAFENEYMEITGEVRLGSMRMATTLEERMRQLSSCSEALTSIVVSRDRLLRIRGNVYLEPINFEGDFDAEYSFALSYDPAKLAQQQRLANLWIEKCGPIVLRQSGSEFAPMFVATLKMKNDSLRKEGSNVKIIINKSLLSLRVDMRRPVGGAYYLNGVRLFEKTIEADKQFSHLRFDIKNKKAEVTIPQDGVIQQFQGKEVFSKVQKAEMVGRWIWDAEKLPEEMVSAPQRNATGELAGNQDESEGMTAEDSLAYKQGMEDLERAMAEEHEKLAARNAAQNATQDVAQVAADDAARAVSNTAPQRENEKKSGGIHWIPLAISGAVLVGGVVLAAMSDKNAKNERDAYVDELDYGSGDYDSHKSSAEDYQNMRTIGIGIAVLGGIGIALSFVF